MKRACSSAAGGATVTGAPQQTSEYVHFDWSLYIGPQLYSTGKTVGRISLDGRFACTVAFGNPPK
jgi:hypothetical protein